MKKPSRFLRLIGIAGLLATLLAGVFATPMAYAGDPDPDPSDDGTVGDIWDGTDPLILVDEGGIYFPWVGNDDESTGLGPADTSVSVMNISDEPAVAFAFVGSHDSAELPDTGGWDVVGPFFLAPWASKTFTAAQLGIAEGTGAPVAFAGYNQLESVTICETNIGGALTAGNDVNGNGRCTDVEVFIGGDDDARDDPALCRVDDSNGDRTNNYTGAFNGPGGLNNDGDCNDAEGGNRTVTVYDSTVLGGYAKQAVDGETLPYTTAADSSVSGYNAVGGFELGEFDDWYFPIAQTNCGPGGCWNTILRIANFGQVVDGEVGNIGSAAVTARFFPADDAQGSLDTGFQLQGLVNTGDVWNIDISDYVPEGWVGSVHVYSDSAVFAMADRVKVGYGAWITNTASNAPYTNANTTPGDLGQYVLFAPDVRLDFFGWNTGINVANLVNDDNNVNIQYFNLYGNAPQALTRRLAPQGMTYFYDPSQAPQDNSVQDPATDVNADVIGSALIWSDYPVAVAVDATKYPESTTSDDPNIFQAMSYSATGNVYTTQAFPLVQKGNPTTGLGATSGINIMNPNSTVAQASVWWVNPSGFGADNFGTSAVAIPGFANGFVYTMTQGNLPNGFYGSAVLTSTVPVAAVTTQVDYQVEWDGTAVWLGYNPCGYYRDNGFGDRMLGGFGGDFDCNLGDPFNTQGGSVKKTFHDETGAEITGVYAELWNEAYYQQEFLGNESFAGIPWVAVGYSDVDGEITWTNVPVGTYYLYVGDTYDQYEGEGTVEGPFTLNEGEDWSIDNVLDRILPEKIVFLGDDAAGVEVCLHADDDGDGVLDDEEVTSPEDCEVADGDGYAEFSDIEPGWYWVSVNQGLENDPVAGFNAYVFGPEFFGLGGVYTNDYADDVNPAEGNIQKVIILPESLLELGPDDVEIAGGIRIYGPDGNLEVEGNVQTVQLLDGIGPNGEAGFILTDFNVPVGGPYTIDEIIEITYDYDGEGGDDPITVEYDNELLTAEDGQVICDDYQDATVDCEASPTDPEIYVFEDQTTRVFNDLTDIEVGTLDVFIRSDEGANLGDVLPGALVCVYDESVAPSELVDCGFTDGNGEVEFDLPEGFYSLTAGHPTHETDGSGIFYYWPSFDAIFGSGMDDVLADDDPFGTIHMALDPQPAVLGVVVEEPEILGGAALQGGPVVPVENAEVRVYLADPSDENAGICLSSTLIAVGYTEVDGFVEFNLDNDTAYCVIVAGILDEVNGSSLAGPVVIDVYPNLESPVEAGEYDEWDTPFDVSDDAGDVDVRLLAFFETSPGAAQ